MRGDDGAPCVAAIPRTRSVEGQVFFRNVLAVCHAFIAFLRDINASRIRVFIVPSGSPVFSAISV